MKFGVNYKTLNNRDIQLLETVKKSGFDCIDISVGDMFPKVYSCDISKMDITLEELREFRKKAEDIGIRVWQTHAPFRYPPRDLEPADREERFEKFQRCIMATAALGSQHVVIHPLYPYGEFEDPNPQWCFDINRDFFSRLAKTAKEYGVTICIENLPWPLVSLSSPDEIAKLVHAINSENVKMCLDTGHSLVLKEQPGEALRKHHDIIKVLHVHDNQGKGDQHLFPFFGASDWEDFAQSLKETKFEGVVSLEPCIPNGLNLECQEACLILLNKILTQIKKSAEN